MEPTNATEHHINIHNYCCTRSQALRLKELGIVQESLFYHFHSPEVGKMVFHSGDQSDDGGWCIGTKRDAEILAADQLISAFIWQELFVLMPPIMLLKQRHTIEAFASSLCFLLVHEVSDVKKINERLLKFQAHDK